MVRPFLLNMMNLLILAFTGILMSGCSSLLYYPTPHEHVDRAKMPIKPEDVFFQSEDGTKLHGWYFHTSRPQQAKGVILFFHGNAQNLSTHFYMLYSAPVHGYDYLIFDYRGYGKSAGKPTPEGTVQDGRAALRWLKEHKPTLPIAIFGQSLGGAIAMRVALDMKTEVPFRLVVVDSTFSSYRAVGRAVLAKHWLTWIFQPLGWLLLSDGEAPEKDLKNLPPIPLIVIHGDRDAVVPYHLGERVFKNAAEPKQFWHVPGGQHTDFMWAEGGKFAKLFYEQLDLHLSH